jgi:hypothetical protein
MSCVLERDLNVDDGGEDSFNGDVDGIGNDEDEI